MSIPQAFDSLAPSYDDAFTHTQIGRYLRGQVHERLARHFRAGDHVLEMGCGTGEDALWLAGRGVRVTATDVSEGMLDVTRAKTAGHALVRVERLDLRRAVVSDYPLPLTPSPLHGEGETLHSSSLSSSGEGEQFEGAFSNFGAVNCLEEWGTLAAWLVERVKPGGIVGLGVMSPLCVWEPLWHGVHGNFRTATRRWRKSVVFRPHPLTPSPPMERGNAPEAIAVRYPTIRRLTRDFAPYFRRVHVQSLGLFLPPSDVFGVIEKRPRLLNLLMGLEKRFGNYGWLAALADHYWIEFERRESEVAL